MNIDKLILEATKKLKTEPTDTNKRVLSTYKLIKAKFLEFKTSKDGVKKLVVNEETGEKVIPEAEQFSILNKMLKERAASIAEYTKANRDDLIEVEAAESEIIQALLPKPASIEDITETVRDYIVDNNFVTVENTRGTMPKSEMGKCIKYVKEKLPQADGKIVSTIVMKFIEK